ncbi:MAG: hypothetical protein WB297_06585 [Actinomycetota bacterium]
MPRLRTLTALLALGVLAAACSSDDQPPTNGPTGDASGMAAIAASADLYAGPPQRVAFGLVMPDNRLLSFGSVDVSFSLVGSAAQTSDPKPGPTATATFVPTYGMPDGSSGPVVTSPTDGRGVYEATDVVFDTAGFWVAKVTADVQGLGPQTAEASFAVLEHPDLPAPGDRAQRTENLTMDSKGVPLAAIDSRAATTDRVPDPELHRWTIARAIREGRPALVVFATPVYCVSRFCGPVTNMVEDLSHRYGDKAVFIHIEIWKDFQNQVANDAALQWLLLPNGDLTEPWLFLIGADGTIVDRWSSMWSESEVEAELDALPPMGSTGS